MPTEIQVQLDDIYHWALRKALHPSGPFRAVNGIYSDC